MSSLERTLRRIQSFYETGDGSHIRNLLTIIAEQIDDIDGVLDTINQWRGIDDAEGVVLDAIGVNLNQPRGAATDPVYRIHIKSKVARSMSDGTIDGIIKILSVTLDCDESEISITELYNETEPDYAGIHVNVPIHRVNYIGISVTQFGRLVNAMVSAGVLANVLMRGTFTFSSQMTVSEWSSTLGFSDGDQNIGGYFGDVYDPHDDVELPI